MPVQRASRSRIKAPRYRPAAAALAVLAALWAAPALARNANFLFSFPPPAGGAFNAPPTVDGVVAGDLGWTGGFRYLFENGTSTPDVALQGIKDNNNLYLSVEVQSGLNWDEDNAIVLAIDPDGNPANRRRIDIFPVFTGVQPVNASGGHDNLAPRAVMYWTNSATWNTGAAAQALPAWLQPAAGNIKVSSPSQGNWNVEVRIPITNDPNTGVNVPAAGDFGLYVNVVEVDAGSGTVSMRVWPPGLMPTMPQGIAGVDLDSTTPDPSVWGNAERGGVNAKGVFFSWNDLNTNQNPTSQISLTAANVFTATVHNTTVNAAGTAVPSSPITATFKIANFGLPSPQMWTPIPVGGNPTGAAVIGANTSHNFSPAPWTLTAAQKTFYQSNLHQCLLVELDSTTPSTLFVNKSATRNMDFVPQAGFQRQAVIGTKGLAVPQGLQAHEFVLTQTVRNTPRNAPWLARIDGGQAINPRQTLVRINPGVIELKLNHQITPPRVRLPIDNVIVRPGALDAIAHAGQPAAQPPANIAVRPGAFLTLVANGSVALRTARAGVFAQPVGPEGLHLAAPVAAQPLAATKGAAPATAHAPELASRVGTLVGSFDNFRTTFPVGTGATLRVPTGATNLQLAIHDAQGLHAQHTGPGFNVSVIHNPAIDGVIAGHHFIDPIRFRLPFGANLPSLVYHGRRKLGRTVTINRHRYQLAEDVGAYGYIFNGL